MGGWEIILILAIILVLLGAGRLGDPSRLPEKRTVERVFLASCLIAIVVVGGMRFLLLFFSR